MSFGQTDRHRQAMRAVVGMTVFDAMQLFAKEYPDFTIRVTWEDGFALGCEKNIDWDRLKVGTRDGIIVEERNIQWG